ncbi:MAG: putative Ig domain-containing protein, partial [Neisseriaceae bacterium]|nr:putative Ig domain-containing protein [Neisseriaceae bacterium]
GGGGIDTIYGGSGNDFIYSNMSIGMLLRYSDNDQWIPKVSQNIEIVTQGSTWGIYIIEEERIVDGGTNSYIQHADNNEEEGDTLYGGSGNDMVVAGNNNDIIYGDEADNEQGHQIGEDGDDELFGMDGDDIIYGGGGNDIINGDSYNSNNQNDFKYLQIEEHDNDIINGNDGNDAIYGNGGNDIIFGDDGDDWIGGDFNNLPEVASYSDINGNDLIDGGNGNDEIHGGGGDDSIIGDKGNDRIWGDYSNSELAHITGNDSIDGGDGNDEICGCGGDDIILGKDGHDWISGDFNNNQDSSKLESFNGKDYIDAGNGDDEIHGGGDNDTIIGGEGDDSILGDYGNSKLAHITGNDTIDGGDGNDKICGCGGDDTILGGDGNDWIGGDFNNLPEVASYSDINGNDFIDGGDGDDEIHGGGGDDSIIGDKGNDRIWGDYGNSELAHISGNDSIDGGDGNDTIVAGGGNDTILGGDGDDLVIGDYYNSQLTHISGNDTIDGGNGNDQLIGSGGDDHIIGGSGNDMLWGDFDGNVKTDIAGNDYLDGGDGDDYLEAGKGDDTLVAGSGKDILIGGEGKDSYVFISTDLQDGQINTILDEDGKGIIIIDGVALDSHDWQAVAGNVWQTDNMQLNIIQENNNSFLVWQSTSTTSLIAIQNYQNGDLSLNLPAYNPPSADVNHAPEVNETLAEQTIIVNQTYNFTLPENLFIDPDGDTLTYSINNLPAWLKFDPQTKTLSGTATIDQIGKLQLTITATDKQGLTATQNFNINIINNPNTPPQTNYSNLTHNIITHIPFEHALPADLFTDADNDALSYKIEDLPNGINFNSQTNTISGVATQAQLIETTIQCGEGQDYSYLPYIINIIENRPPKVKNKISQLNTGATKYFEYTIPADLFTDPDGEILNINVNNLPQWLNYNPQTNTINGIAPIESAGINNITIIATDNANNSIEHTLQINVNLDNIPNAIYAN